MPFADVNGQNLHFEDSGGDGPAVLLMHGFLMDLTMFDPQVEALAPGYRCVRFDSRGFGETGWDGKPFTLYDTVSDAVGLLDQLGIGTAHVVGMSMGGYAALRLALRHPDRLDRLVLIGSRHRADPPEGQAQYREAAAVWSTAGPVDPLAEGLMTAIIGPRESHAALWDVWMPKWKAFPGANYVAGSDSLVDRDDLTDDDLRRITRPTLLVHGEQDFGVPIENAEAAAAVLPDCRGLVRVQDGAHSVNLTHPEVVNPAIQEFLAG